jgi:hypothetical protein
MQCKNFPRDLDHLLAVHTRKFINSQNVGNHVNAKCRPPSWFRALEF